MDNERSQTSRRQFETLEVRQMLTATLSLSDLTVLVAADDGFKISDYAPADLNDDGVPELVVAQQPNADEATSSGGRVVVFARDAVGSLYRVGQHDVSFNVDALTLNDANGDGTIDVGIRSGVELNLTSLTFDGTASTLGDVVRFDGAWVPEQVWSPLTYALVDLNLDQNIDVAVHTETGTFVAMADSATTFVSPVRYAPSDRHNLHYAEFVDVNNDGLLDLVTSQFDSADGQARTIVLQNDGSGVLEESTTLEPTHFWYESVTADVNHDGNIDVVGGGYGIDVQYGNGDGTFQNPTLLLSNRVDWQGGGTFDRIEVLDVNADGFDDIFVGDEYVLHAGVTPSRILFGSATSFQKVDFPNVWPGEPQRILDVAGDAKAEFLWSDDDGIRAVRQIEPHSLDVQAWSIPNIGRALLDANADGITDVVLVHSDSISLLESNGAGEFEQSTLSLDTSLRDVDVIHPLQRADGATEFFVMGYSGNQNETVATFFRRDGTEWTSQTVAMAGRVVACHRWVPNCFAYLNDLNEDGNDDLVVTLDAEQNSLFSLTNDGDTWTSTSIDTYNSSLPNGIAVPTYENNVQPFSNGQFVNVDLDHDGQNEYVEVSYGVNFEIGTLSIYRLVDGERQLESTLESFTFFELPNLFSGDYDGDGNVDFSYVEATSFTLPILNVFFNNGNFEFTEPVPMVGQEIHGDGLVIARPRNFGGGSVSTVWHREDVVDFETVLFSLDDDLVVEDVDGDGDEDVIALNEQGVTLISRRQVGDLNDDQNVDGSDLDYLYANLGTRDFGTFQRLDLNHDTSLDESDVDYLVAHGLKTRRGDTNLDGNVDFEDFLAFSSNVGSEEATWQQGDFTGDNVVDFADFLALSGNFGFACSRM